MASWERQNPLNLLLLHEFRIWHVVNDVFPKNGRGEHWIDLFGVHVLKFPVEDELITLWSKVHRNFSAKKNKREDIAILELGVSIDCILTVFDTHFCLAFEEKFEWLNAVCYRASDEWQPVKHYRWFIRILEQNLLQDICKNG